jgi:hypothetical protein
MFHIKNILKRMMGLSLLASLGLVALLSLAQNDAALAAAVAPPLGVAQQFGALGNSGVTGSAGAGTAVTGDVGSSPTATIINFPPSSAVLPFIVHYAIDGVVDQAHLDAITAYNALAIQGQGTVLPDNLAGQVITPGVYSFTNGAPDLPASATLTLNDPTGNGIFVFNVGSTLTANVLSNVVGTANPCNIYWRVGTSATLNGTNFRGIVIASASITLGAGANLAGQALAGTGATGAVSMAGAGGNTIGGCSNLVTAPVVTPPLTGVALSKAFFPTTIAPGGTSMLTITLSNNNVGAVTLTSALTDNLPGGMTIAGPVTTTCGGTAPIAILGSSLVTVPIGASIPGGSPGFCTVMVNVTAPAGTFVNTTSILATDAPIPTAAPASATLNSGSGLAIPTLNEWGMIFFMVFAGLGSVYYLRKYRRV